MQQEMLSIPTETAPAQESVAGELSRLLVSLSSALMALSSLFPLAFPCAPVLARGYLGMSSSTQIYQPHLSR